VSFCDSQVHEPARVPVEGITDILALKPMGGGGTSMENGLNYIKEHGRDVEVVIVLTDGCDSWSGVETTYPFQTVWVISERGISAEDAERRIPYGAKVKIE
jgi:predicted metal-dependent peptidase